MSKSKREREIQGRGTVGTTAVFTVVERSGDARSQVLDDVNGDSAKQPITANVDKQATLNTDTSPIYNKGGNEFAKHERVDHGKEEYFRGTSHVNTVEGYFGHMKRSISGT